MSERKYDINDDEIRVIAPESNDNPLPRKVGAGKGRLILFFSLGLLILGGLIWLIILFNSSEESSPIPTPHSSEIIYPQAAESSSGSTETDAFCSVIDTTLNNIQLKIFIPRNATPSLEIGKDVPGDSSIILAAMAADVRGDNGEIAGAYVLKGNLISKGESKAGFCSIINGEITIGVAEATPMLEQALETEGYFFRQYPLVVGGQLVENKPKGRALRKALAEYEGKICIIASLDRLTFHDFAQVLVELGVKNAIYLLGGDSPVIYVDKFEKRHIWGNLRPSQYEYINYIVWK
ncbi:MAG: phosphodiester glycosidase family protein [Muribaculaceae bacterium]|nr:phosphodiester glycosidase family protein [Muribaculaceae bacterium]